MDVIFNGPCDRCGLPARALFMIFDERLVLHLCIGCWARKVVEQSGDGPVAS